MMAFVLVNWNGERRRVGDTILQPRVPTAVEAGPEMKGIQMKRFDKYESRRCIDQANGRENDVERTEVKRNL